MRMGSAAARVRAAGMLLAASALAPAVFAAGVSQLATAAGGYGKLPLTFEENRGQTDPRVKYISRGSGYALFLTPTDAVLSLTGTDGKKKSVSTALRMNFAGAREASLSGLDALQTRSHQFLGSDPKAWRTNLRHFGRVAYKGIYPGVDAVFYGNQRQLEYDFIVAPGADYRKIRLTFDGVRSVATAPNGDLVLRTAIGDVRQLRPVVYQEIAGKRRIIDGRYEVSGNEVRFQVGAYDARKPLVIDPVLAWSTFLGGTGQDEIRGMAVDSGGNVVVTGMTASADFRATIQYVGIARGGTSDAFVSKIANTGTALLWSAFFGGSGADEGNAVALDPDATVFITGSTDSPTIPLVSPLQSTIGGGIDVFVARISSDGATLLYSTYLGGFYADIGWDIAVDSQRQAVVVGETASFNFPATRNGLFGTQDAFALKLTATGNARVWSTFIGGHYQESAQSVAIDTADAAYVTGWTNSFSFPVTAGVVQTAIGSTSPSGPGPADAFVMKIGTTGVPVYSTFLGGTGYDSGIGIAVDATFNAYIVGETESPNYPLANPLQATYRGNRDAFVTKLNPTATARLYSTFLGGTNQENAGDIVVRNDSAFVVGSTLSGDFPVANGTQLVNGGGWDVFMTQLDAAGTGLPFSSYFGSNGDDFGFANAIDASGNLYVAGGTSSGVLLGTTGALQTAMAGVRDGFVTKISNCTVTITPIVNGAPGFIHSFVAQTGVLTVTGTADCTWNATATVPWISIVSQTATAGSGTLTYAISQNPGAARSGAILIAGVQYTVTQQGAPLASGCVYPLDPAGIITDSRGVTGTFTIGVTSTACTWVASSNVPWLQVFPLSGNTTTTATYTVFPNFSTKIRIGTITVTGGGVSQTFTVTQAGSLLTEPERFVTLLYSNYFGRYPNSAEIALQVSALATTPRGVLAANFFNSPEFLAGGRFVAGLYYGLLARDPEFGGWLFQRNALSSGATTQSQLVANFLNSAEFIAKYGTLSNEQFVNLLYVQVLGRSPSPSELAFQTGVLNAGGANGRVTMATAFLNTPEFQTRLNARMSAFLLYATLLQRDPSPSELLSRETQLATGTPLATLAEQFIASPEFQAQLL